MNGQRQVTEDHYQVLGINMNTSAAGIKDAYHKLCLENHPDRLSNATVHEQAAGEARIKNVINAYQVLSDPVARATYDRGRPQHAFKQPAPARNTNYTAPRNNPPPAQRRMEPGVPRQPPKPMYEVPRQPPKPMYEIPRQPPKPIYETWLSEMNYNPQVPHLRYYGGCLFPDLPHARSYDRAGLTDMSTGRPQSVCPRDTNQGSCRALGANSTQYGVDGTQSTSWNAQSEPTSSQVPPPVPPRQQQTGIGWLWFFFIFLLWPAANESSKAKNSTLSEPHKENYRGPVRWGTILPRGLSGRI